VVPARNKSENYVQPPITPHDHREISGCVVIRLVTHIYEQSSSLQCVQGSRGKEKKRRILEKGINVENYLFICISKTVNI
jgi:hypothetical protein